MAKRRAAKNYKFTICVNLFLSKILLGMDIDLPCGLARCKDVDFAIVSTQKNDLEDKAYVYEHACFPESYKFRGSGAL